MPFSHHFIAICVWLSTAYTDCCEARTTLIDENLKHWILYPQAEGDMGKRGKAVSTRKIHVSEAIIKQPYNNGAVCYHG